MLSKLTKNKCAKILAGFMVFMFAMTVISRGAASMTVAQVAAIHPGTRSLETIVTGEGTMEQQTENGFWTLAGLVLEKVYVQKGQKLRKGDVLAKVQAKSLEEKIQTLQKEIRGLELQSEEAQDTIRRNRQEKRETIKSQKKQNREQYQQKKQELTAAVETASTEYDNAKETAQTEKLQAARTVEDAAKPVEVDGTLAAGRLELAQKQKKLDRLKEQKQKGSEGENTEDDISALEDEIASLQLQLQIQEQTLQQKQADQKETLKRARDDYRRTVSENRRKVKKAKASLKKARNKLAECHPEKGTEAEREIKTEINYTKEQNDLQIREKQKMLRQLQELAGAGGAVRADQDGVVTAVHVKSGDVTNESAVLLYAGNGEKLQFTSLMEKREAKKLSVGDEVTLKTAEKKIRGLTISSIEEQLQSDGTEKRKVTVQVPQGKCRIGQVAEMTVRKESGPYDVTIPLTALHTEQGKNYVYVIRSVKTVLGKQKTASRVDVTVLKRNGSFAAISEDNLSQEDQVITEATRIIRAGDRVRLQEG